MSEPTVEDAMALLDQFHQSDWDELSIRAGDFELHVSKTPRDRRARTDEAPIRPSAVPKAAPAGPPALDATSPDRAVERDLDLLIVRAPSLGTFYRAPKPGAEPFVTVGQVVEPTTELCIIEVMKLFTAVQAGVSGVVRDILVADAELVEHDQPLVVVEPLTP